MIITDFSRVHLARAEALALQNYREERIAVPALPPTDSVPELDEFADNGFGVVAEEDGVLIGFLCFYPPWDNVFTTTARGTFSPVHAHGAAGEGREHIYRRMYQAAAEKLVRAGINIHAVAFYAHDAEAIRALFTYGFGLRCVDAVRPMEPVGGVESCPGYEFTELEPSRRAKLLPLKNALIAHLGRSPSFMWYPSVEKPELDEEYNRRCPRYFTASVDGESVAFLEVIDGGENFACGHASMKNICGAYCAPGHRGRSVYQNLLNFAINTLKAEGYTRFGVDFESINPTALGFWTKYFDAYTNSVVRRIDDNVFVRYGQ